MPAEDHHVPPNAPAVSMSELLASCAAAAAISTPPRAPEPHPAKPPHHLRPAEAESETGAEAEPEEPRAA
ncbi:hypothetical protein [Streptomyces sp. NPDC058045]|uniref:hypothetical protein n=1 Tax=Streptomyces sp. NPDC058045 TaxID=3346311 RepID=UPI0036EB0DD2